METLPLPSTMTNREATSTVALAVCCECGINIDPNPTHTCLTCLRNRVDISAGIGNRVTLHQCRGCLKYLTHTGWKQLELESTELLSCCLKKINGLAGIRLVDAQWIWTEPHSKRLKVKLVVQKEIMVGAVLQETIVVEYIVRNQQCVDCQASYTTGAYKAIVQLRQRVEHKRTFLHLEQMILKYNAASNALSIEGHRDGMDFYYAERNQAVRFCDFLRSFVPVSIKTSKKLVSQDDHSNIHNFKFTYVVEILPLCKDDVVILPKKLACNLSDISRVVLVQKVTSAVTFIDPFTCQTGDMGMEKYLREPFFALLSSSQLVEFVVLDSTPYTLSYKPSAPQKHQKHLKFSDLNSLRPNNIRKTSISASTGNENSDNMNVLSATNERTSGKKRRANFDDDHIMSNNMIPSKENTRARYRLAEVTIAKASDIGKNDVTITVITHLGFILRAGDTVLGYDLTNCNYNNKDADAMQENLPEVVLVRKQYSRSKQIEFEMRQLEYSESDMGKHGNKNTSGSGVKSGMMEEDMEEYRQQLYSDVEMRKHVNLFKKKSLTRNKKETMEMEDQVDEEDNRALKKKDANTDMMVDEVEPLSKAQRRRNRKIKKKRTQAEDNGYTDIEADSEGVLEDFHENEGHNEDDLEELQLNELLDDLDLDESLPGEELDGEKDKTDQSISNVVANLAIYNSDAAPTMSSALEELLAKEESSNTNDENGSNQIP